MRIGGGQVHGMAPQLEHSGLKGGTGAGGVFCKDHCQRFPGQTAVRNSVAYIVFQLIRQIEDLKDILGGEIQQL